MFLTHPSAHDVGTKLQVARSRDLEMLIPEKKTSDVEKKKKERKRQAFTTLSR